MPFSELQGQERAVAQLRAALRGERLHHAFLITGIPGVGVPELASRFAEALLCPNALEGCGACSACDRSRRGLHADLLVASLDREAAVREVKVEAIRALCAGLQLKPSEARRKVALILDADRLSPSAQNALLKTLEEPPAQTVLILACEGEERLLPTVRSRCLRIALTPLREEALAARLVAEGRLDGPTAALAARLARGSVERAQSFGKGFGQRRERLLGLAQTLVGQRAKPVAALAALELGAEFSEGRERASEAIEVLAGVLRDLLVLKGGGKAADLLAPDQVERLGSLAAGLAPVSLLGGLDALRDAATALEGNGAPRLQLEAAGLRLAGLAP